LTAFCANDNLTRFDTDGDGFVDGIFLIHAGGGAEAEPNPTKRRNMIWSHKWTLPTPFTNSGVRVFAYSTEPEDGHVGVFCHEFGHVLGLPDLYDTTYRSEGVGNWCLMGGGSWGGGGDNPTRMSCWCLNKLGWLKPKAVSGNKTLTISPLATSSTACYRIAIGSATGPEYFLLENRQNTGMDSSLPTSGLALWHIDERQSGNTNPLSYLVGLVQADGKKDLEKNKNRGDAGDLFPGSAGVTAVSDTTNPSTRANDGTASGVALSAITAVGDKIKVKVKA
jgi:immune inhibitor A